MGKGEGLKVLFLIELIYCDIIGAWEGVCHVDPVGKKKRKKRFPALSAGNKKLKNLERFQPGTFDNQFQDPLDLLNQSK